MKILFAFISALLFNQWAFADCPYGRLNFYPSSNTIAQNSIFMIEGILEPSGWIEEINKSYPTYLKSKSGNIKLKALELCFGYGQAQILLVPETPLKAGAEYELVIENLPEPPTNRGYTIEKPIFPKWKVSNEKDTKAPVWKNLPTQSNKVLKEYGCGPEAHVDFNCKVETEKQNCLIRTTLKNTKTGESSVYYIPYSELLEIGHDMCNGYFGLELEKATTYEVQFELVDMSNNRTKWAGKSLRFTSPVLGS